MKKRKKLVFPNIFKKSEDIDEFEYFYSKLSEEEKQKFYEEELKRIQEGYDFQDFLNRIEKNQDYIDITNKLITETNEDKGLTAYEISKDLGMDQGNVRKRLVELKKENFVLINKRPRKERMRHEYWMTEDQKKRLISLIPWIGVDYEEEVEDILILLSERKLINPANEIKKRSEYRDRSSLSYTIGKTALSVAQEIEVYIDTPTIEIEKLHVEDLVPYGIAFNAIRDAIFKKHLKCVFGNKERIRKLNIFPYPRAYEFYELEEFIKDAEALKNRSEKVIDRMFFRKPEFFPDSKNGGNKS